ncbi:MAG: 30S ribosomal protein S8 [Dehalococcoidia bacterium]|nr:30S ribosomal protein S8 [Dehalococcoidia bacterium]
MSGLTDPMADMLTRIRNAAAARHDSVTLPASNLRVAVARILKDEGFVRDVEVADGKSFKTMKISLRYDERKTPMFRGIQRVSKPGRRVYSGKSEVPRVSGGLGITIVSTSKGVMTGQEARAKSVGGEVLCKVW